MTYKISTKLHLFCLVAGFSTYFLFYDFVNRAIEKMSNTSMIVYPTSNLTVNFLLQSLFMVAVMSLVHEVIHKFFYERFGGKAIIGFKGIYAYTQEVSKVAISTWKFVIILLMPLILISLATLPFHQWYTDLIFFYNLVGSTGDIVMTVIVLKYGAKGKIIDEDKGFTIVYNN